MTCLKRLHSIPLIFHQICFGGVIPVHLASFSQSWREWNPDLYMVYWTDRTLRLFVAEKTPEYLPLFDGFLHEICRLDLGRYLLLKYYGGLVADLDCQCLCPIEPLLQGHELLIAPEPILQCHQKNVVNHGIQRLPRTAFMASSAGHPFWSDLLATLFGTEYLLLANNAIVRTPQVPCCWTMLLKLSLNTKLVLLLLL